MTNTFATHPLLESIDGIGLILDGSLCVAGINRRGRAVGGGRSGDGPPGHTLALDDADKQRLGDALREGRDVEVTAALNMGGVVDRARRYLATPILRSGAAFLLLTELTPEQQLLSSLASAGVAEDLANILLVVLDLDGRVHRINRATEELLGVSADYLVGRDWLEEVMPAHHRAKAREGLTRLRTAAPDTQFDHNEIILSRDGTERTIGFSSAPLRAHDGEVLGIFCWGRDVTDELSVLAGLREREGRYRELIIAAPQGLIVHRADAVLFCNPAAASMLDTAGPADVLGCPWSRFVSTESRQVVAQRGAEVLAGRTPRPAAEVLLRRASGERFPAELSERRTLYEGQPAVLVSFSDIADRKHLEARARRATQTLALVGRCSGLLLQDLPLSTRLGEMCTAVAHDAAYPAVWIGVAEGYGADGLTGPEGPAASAETAALARGLWEARHDLFEGPELALVLDFDAPETLRWHGAASAAGIRAAAAVRVLDGGNEAGILGVFVTTMARLTPEERGLLTELAQLLAVGLSSARLDRQRQAAEAAAQRKAAQHAAVAAMGVEALRGGTVQNLIELVCDGVASTLGSDLCVFATLEPGSERLRLAAVRGAAAPLFEVGQEIEDVGGSLVAVLRDDVPHLASTRLQLAHRLMGAEDLDTIWAVVRTPDGPLGLLEVAARRDGQSARFSAGEQDFLQAAANILAVAAMRQSAEAAARESRQTLDRAQRLSQMGSWDLHVSSGMLFWSDELYRIYRRPREVGPGTGAPLQNVHPADQAQVDRCLRHSLETGEPFTFEARIFTDDGQERTVHVEGSTTLDPQGSPTRNAGAVLDITRRSRAEQQGRLLSAAVEHLGEMVVITDTFGNIEYANPAFQRVTGYTVEEVIGRNVQFLRSPDAEQTAHQSKLWPTIKGGDTWEGLFRNHRKDGSAYDEENTVSPVRDENGEIAHFVAIKRDVTHELELERRLRQAAKMEAIGRLTGGIAHDFNNILTGILSCAFFLLEDLDESDPRREDAREIHDATKRAAELTQQLLAFSRKQVLRPEIIDLVPAVTHMEKMIRRVIGEDVTLQVDAAGEMLVKVDAGQFHHVILNLVVNSRDAMPAGGRLRIVLRPVSIATRTSTLLDELHPGDYIALSVSDTGTGMDEATQLKVFDPFFTTKGVGEGTGLGLSQVYGIVRQSGGAVDVTSKPGRGTTFTLYFPTARRDAARPSELRLEPAGIGTETILVVEDDDLVRRSLGRILSGHGYHVLEASSPSEARAICFEFSEPIHLLVTDAVLPELSGKLLAAELRDQRPSMRTLLMSGHDTEMLTRHGIYDPDMVLLHKPVSSGVLLLTVREVLDAPLVP